MAPDVSTARSRAVALEVLAAARPHFFALPMLGALAGIAAAEPSKGWVRPALSVMIAGAGWGVGQLLNDLLDRATDAVNAPERAIVSGRLSARHALLTAVVTGIVLAIATAALHPCGWALAACGVLLILSYNLAKSRPLLGNVSLGALIALTVAMGIAASSTEGTFDGLVVAISRARATLVLTAAIAAWYLQANYEKDRKGDQIAGYLTLAVVLGVRASAIVRAFAMVAIASFIVARVGEPLGATMASLAGLVGVYSTVGPIMRGDDEAALEAYRPSVVASLLAMASLSVRAAPALVLALLGAALLVSELAFRRTRNP